MQKTDLPNIDSDTQEVNTKDSKGEDIERENLDWKDDENMTMKICKFSDIPNLRDTHKFVRRNTGEELIASDKEDTVFLVYDKRKDKLIGLAMISKGSPNKHFPDEKMAEFPYLYNFICDQKYKKKKLSVALLYAVKRYLKDMYKCITLDVISGNERALKFFTRNLFVVVGEWTHPSKNKYKCLMYKYML